MQSSQSKQLYVDQTEFPNQTEEILAVERRIQDKFNFEGAPSCTITDTSVFKGSLAEVTGLWLEEVESGDIELVFEMVIDGETEYIRLDWEDEEEKIESIFKAFRVSSDDAADIIGKNTYVSDSLGLRFYNTPISQADIGVALTISSLSLFLVFFSVRLFTLVESSIWAALITTMMLGSLYMFYLGVKVMYGMYKAQEGPIDPRKSYESETVWAE